MARAHAEPLVVGENRECSRDLGSVVERLAHAHEHHVANVGHSKLGRKPPRLDELKQNFLGTQVPNQAHGARQTEPATANTPDLSGETNRGAATLWDEYGFDARSILEANAKLGRPVRGSGARIDRGLGHAAHLREAAARPRLEAEQGISSRAQLGKRRFRPTGAPEKPGEFRRGVRPGRDDRRRRHV